MATASLKLLCLYALLQCTALWVDARQQPLVGDNNDATLRTIITPAVSHFVSDVIHQAQIPGLSMGVVRLGADQEAIVELATWGNQTEEDNGNDMKPDALFAMASCSKAFLVASIGILMDDYAQARNVTSLPGSLTRFDWETKLHDVFPDEWGTVDKWGETRINLRDAFGHTSGLGRHDFSYRPGDTAVDILRRLKELPEAFELRQQWHYNNHPFMVGAHLVSRLSHVSYSEFVETRIFKPSGMSSTTFSPSEAAASGVLTQTWTRGMRRIPFVFPDQSAELFAGAGGIISNTEDMIKWVAVLLNGGIRPGTNTTIIPPSVVAEMTTARAIVSGVPAGPLSIIGYGMGWFRMSYRGHDVVWHFGAVPGFSTLVAFLPADNFGAVLLANTDEKQDENLGIFFRLVDEALELPAVESNELKGALTSLKLQVLGTSATVEDPSFTVTSQPELHIDSFAGTYEDPAYGQITLCSHASTSTYCQRTLADFAPIEHTQSADVKWNLYATWPRVWSSHLRLARSSATSLRFSARLPRLFPGGYGHDRTPFEYWDSIMSVGYAEFVVEEGRVVGFALVMDSVAASARAARKPGAGAREVGDAWFRRVPGPE